MIKASELQSIDVSETVESVLEGLYPAITGAAHTGHNKISINLTHYGRSVSNGVIKAFMDNGYQVWPLGFNRFEIKW